MESFEKISLLILASLREDIGKEDLLTLEAWASSSPENARLLSQLSSPDVLASKLAAFRELDSDALWQRTLEKIEENSSNAPWRSLWRPVGLSRLWKCVSVAVTVLLVAGGIYVFRRSVSHEQKEQSPQAGQPSVASSGVSVATGIGKAKLELADGSVILLDKIKNGTLAGQGNVRIEKTAEGELSYLPRTTTSDQGSGNNASGGNISNTFGYNTLSTPRGGQYKLVLPDGTRVWLNAGSSLKYPASLGVQGVERSAELTGEAYFEVASLPVPFKVFLTSPKRSATGQRPGSFVEVLGTHFDIMAYNDEPVVRTSLYAGAIRVSAGLSPVILKPGQQAVFGELQSAIRVLPVSNNTLSWVDGNLSLDGQDLETIMRQLSRLYDVDIEYVGKKPSLSLAGTISHNTPIDGVLKILNVQSDGRLGFSRIGERKVRVTNKE